MLKLIKQLCTIRRNHCQATQVVLIKTGLAIPLQRQRFDPTIRRHGDKILKLNNLLQQTFHIVRFKDEQPLIESTKRPFNICSLRLARLAFKTFQNNV